MNVCVRNFKKTGSVEVDQNSITKFFPDKQLDKGIKENVILIKFLEKLNICTINNK